MRAVVAFLAVAVAAGPVLADSQSTGGSGPTTTQQAAANATVAAQQTRAASALGLGTANVLLSTSAQADSCPLLTTVGVGTLIAAVNLNLTTVDETCRHIRVAKAFAALASVNPDLIYAAAQELCELPDAKLAMERAGTPCDRQRVP